MSDQTEYYQGGGRRGLIRNFVLSEMMRGAGWAAMAIAVVVVPMLIIYVVSLFLPEDSKNMPGPMPFSALVAPATTA
jgi:hypothetical protein